MSGLLELERAPSGPVRSPYRHFSRAEWAALRADTPLTLTIEVLDGERSRVSGVLAAPWTPIRCGRTLISSWTLVWGVKLVKTMGVRGVLWRRAIKTKADVATLIVASRRSSRRDVAV